MQLRKASLSDVQDILRVENAAWFAGGAASEIQIRSRIITFPDGVIVATLDKEVIGVVVGEIIDSSYIDRDGISWKKITDNGSIKASHDPDGDALFGVDLSVDPTHQGGKIGALLLQEIGKMAIRKNLKMGILGARMPKFHEYSNRYTPEEYIRLRGNDGRLIDPELRFYERNGLKLYRVIKDYFEDPESMNYGVICIWKNPFYVRNKILGKIIGFVGSVMFRI